MEALYKIWLLLEPKYKKLFFLQLLFMIFVALILASGVGAIVPVITVFVDPDLLLTNKWGHLLYEALGAGETKTFTLRLLMGYAILYITTQLSLIALSYSQNKYVQNLLANIRDRMLRCYMEKQYEFFLGSNSAILLKNIVNETAIFVTSLVMQILKCLTNLFIIFVLFIALFIFEPWITLISIGVGGFLFVAMYATIHKQLGRWGKQRESLVAEINRTAHQSLTGIKDIQILGCEDTFIDQFGELNDAFSKLNTKYLTFSQGLGSIANIVLFGGALMTLLLMESGGHSIVPYIPLITFFGVAISKIFPIAMQVFTSGMAIRFYWPSYKNIYDALQTESPPSEHDKAARLPATKKITLSDISYKYPEAKEPAIHGMNLEIQIGTKVGFVGSSGAGKSTTMDILIGLILPSAGNVFIDNTTLDATNKQAWRNNIGYVPQEIFISDTTVKKNIAFGIPAHEIDEERMAETIRLARLEKFIANQPKGLDTELGERGVRLSGGEKQRVGIARALFRSPNILVMDEPTSSLDAITEKQIIDDVLASAKDITIIIITHRLASVRHCDSIFYFEGGEITHKGTYQELLEESPEFEAMDSAWNTTSAQPE